VEDGTAALNDMPADEQLPKDMTVAELFSGN
jgi:hypothetical protein